ncbi:hypothetical protein BJ912DRAFT_1040157 [Pholiota molesta]|nr:hypothetical protein BJ912DRAFT_1040157 [Pholiota molesta]
MPVLLLLSMPLLLIRTRTREPPPRPPHGHLAPRVAALAHSLARQRGGLVPAAAVGALRRVRPAGDTMTQLDLCRLIGQRQLRRQSPTSTTPREVNEVHLESTRLQLSLQNEDRLTGSDDHRNGSRWSITRKQSNGATGVGDKFGAAENCASNDRTNGSEEAPLNNVPPEKFFRWSSVLIFQPKRQE